MCPRWASALGPLEDGRERNEGLRRTVARYEAEGPAPVHRHLQRERTVLCAAPRLPPSGRPSGLVTACAPGWYAYRRDGDIVGCPWHGPEFDISTGRSLCTPEDWRLHTYPVSVEPPSLETYPVPTEAEWIFVHIQGV